MSESKVETARNAAEFAKELLERLQVSDGNENVLISPFAIQSCMALAYAGAQGYTANEIAQVMRYHSDNPVKVANIYSKIIDNYKDSDLLKIANFLYVQKGKTLNPEFSTIATEQLHAVVRDFDSTDSQAATQSINSQMAKATDGKISDIITPDCLEDHPQLLLLNALHFKGEWQEKFDKDQTMLDDFWVANDKSAKLEFMRKTAEFKLGFFEELSCMALEMPYRHGGLSMFMLLPKQRDGLPQLMEKLQYVNILDLPEGMCTADVMVQIPKFKIEYSVEMSDVLREMGIHKAFCAEADFSQLLNGPSEGLYISNVIHKTSMEISEEGTEAAAATAMKVTAYSMPPSFIADHPFLYWIWDGQTILFAGAFVNVPGSA